MKIWWPITSERREITFSYRVTPAFEGDNLVASGVQIEACSVEDRGEEISFNVFVFNVQPGVTIDYATGGQQPERR